MSRPRVSVVIPCFNYERYVGSAVRSALAQEDVAVEVIVVDDASTDGSADVVAGLAAADPRVTLLRRTTNGGPVAAFNRGLAAASGEFLVRLDADDLLTPGSLARSVAVCRRFPSVGMVYGHPVHFTGTLPAPRRPRPANWRPRVIVWRGADWLRDRCRSGVNVITSPEVLMRMSVVRQVGGQRPLAHTHDMEMWLRIASVSDVGYVRGTDQAWHREHPESLSLTAADALGLQILRERRDAFDMLFGRPVPAQTIDPDLRAMARRTLAREALDRAAYEYDRGRAPARSVGPLVDFALETDPDARDLPQWAALARRMAAGERWFRRRPWLLLRPVRRVLTDRCRQRRWSRTGLYDATLSPHGRPA